MKKILSILCLGAISIWAKPTITVTIGPQSYFVKQIAQDTLEVNVMVPPNAEPHSYEPKPQQMKALEKSDIYFTIGLSEEDKWIEKFKKTYPNLNVVPTDKGIEKIAMAKHSHHDHDKHEHHDHANHDHDDHDHDDHDKHDHDHDKHDHDHDKHEAHEDHGHHHPKLDPHIWVDPISAKVIAKNITNELVKKYPKNSDLYKANLKKFEEKCDKLDIFIKDTLKDVKSREFIVYHPSWGYYAKQYNLKQIPVEVEGKEPKIKDLAELIDEAKEHHVKVIFVQPNFSQKSAKLVAEATNSKVVSINHLSADWENELRKTTEAFKEGLK